jgi:hypothetical protein
VSQEATVAHQFLLRPARLRRRSLRGGRRVLGQRWIVAPRRDAEIGDHEHRQQAAAVDANSH